MANLVELIPLIVIVLILLSASGTDVDRIEIAVDGDRTVDDLDDALIVGGGTVTVPEGQTVAGKLYVIGGDAEIAGRVEGSVHHLGGNLSVAESATITGELELVGGDRSVADGASIGRVTDVATTVTSEQTLGQQVFSFVLQAVVLVVAGFAIARRNPDLLRNVGDSVTEHGLVSGTVGLLAGLSGLALVVFMAVTVVLIPVSIASLAVGIAVVAYGYLAFGYLIGQRLPIDRVGVATAAGSVSFLVALEVLGRIPVVGPVVQLLIIVLGIGAVLITYFGLREFEPVDLPS